MEEEFLNPRDENNQVRHSIERYEQMIRNKDAYFFDVEAFLNIIDYYIERNDPVKALQVVEFAQSQHPDSVEFLLREAQLLAMVDRYNEALAILDKAEMITPTDADLFMIRGSIYSQQQKFELAIENFNKAIPLADELDLLYLNLAYVYESWGDYDKAINYLALCLEDNPENEVAMYELAFCFEFTERFQDSIDFFTELGKIRGQNGRCNNRFHDLFLKAVFVIFVIHQKRH
jgi:tetratricopeptide (TPR) repeat protein